jgi:hypothetical protein
VSRQPRTKHPTIYRSFLFFRQSLDGEQFEQTKTVTLERKKDTRFMSMSVSGIGAGGDMHAISGASSSAPPQQKMSNLFNSIDTSGSGSISQAQFGQAFQSGNAPAVFRNQGASAIFAALDPNRTGSVSKADFVAGMSKLMVSPRADQSVGATPQPAGTQANAATGLLNIST